MSTFYYITWTVICYCATLSFAARPPDVGPIHLFPVSNNNNTKIRGRQFAWQASLDPVTRIGSSKETSVLNWSSHYEDEEDSIASMKRVSQKLVEMYPTWLTKGSVSFGLLRARQQKEERKGNNNNKNGIAIQPRFINFDLLSFGKVKVIRASRRRMELQIPVTGGFLSLDHDGKKRDRGCLTFHVWREEFNNNDKPYCRFCTTISGDYRPTIAGSPTARPIRKLAYLSSQSLVHAYVMWRFHRVWNNRVRYVC